MAGPADGLFPQAVLIVAVCLGPLGQEHPLFLGGLSMGATMREM